MRLSKNGRALLTAIAVATAAMAASIAYAAIPDSNDVIHGCYNPSGANTPNGTTLNIVNSDTSSCKNNQTEIAWNQTGPPGPAGDDGVSVTSAALTPGDTNCPAGGSQFTAAGANVTFACNGLKGDKGDTGDTGGTGPTGPAGPSAAFTNYGDGFHTIAAGTTQTVASVTVPAGNYVFSASVAAVTSDTVQCSFLAAAPVHGHIALFQSAGRLPLIGDATLGLSLNSVLLRCTAQGGTGQAAGEIIATQVGSITPSE